MKYYIIAGEASGDLHGSNLIIELKKNDAEAAIRCWGGDKMRADIVNNFNSFLLCPVSNPEIKAGVVNQY